MNTYKTARVLVFIGVAFASLSAILIRLADAPPLVIAFYRMLFTSIMLAPVLLTRAGSRRDRQSPERSLSTPRTVGLLAGSGAFLALHFATWNASLSYTTVASSVVLVTLHPIFVAVGSVLFLREHVPPSAFGFIVLAIVGSGILSYGDIALGPEAMLGNALAVAGAISVAGYMLLGRFLRRHVTALSYNWSVYTVAALILLPAALLAGNPLGGYAPVEFAIFAALALFCTVLGHSIFNWALKYVSASSVSTSILLEPVFATLMALVIFEEVPGVAALVGGLIVVASLYMVIRLEHTAGSPLTSRSRQSGLQQSGNGDHSAAL
ncbi:MAG: DMT family transporter [Spirochaetia bacterium]